MDVVQYGEYSQYFVIIKRNTASKNCESLCCISEAYIVLHINNVVVVQSLRCLILCNPTDCSTLVDCINCS